MKLTLVKKMDYRLRCKGTCSQFFQFEWSLAAYELTLPSELKSKFIFYCDCGISTTLNNEVYLIKFNDRVFFFEKCS